MAVATLPAGLLVTVTDEHSVPVASAQVTLVHEATQTFARGETDYAGRRELVGLDPGLYQVRVEKEGFYATILKDVRVGETARLEVRLNHEQELRESIDVVYSPPAIDPAKTSSSEDLDSDEIINLPYATTRDFRNILPFIPGVLQDATGQVHLNGSATYQMLDQLDGFNISHPASGLLEMRVNPDALREISVQGGRYSAEYGKGSGGVLSLTTGMGDDRYRFSATNFVPSVQTRKGFNLNDWTPRATFSGPLRKKRAWFFDAVDGDYQLNIINELPSGADRSHAWRVDNLAKAQVSLNQASTLTTSFLINRFHADHAGLSQFTPVEATQDRKQVAYLFTLKDQSYFSNGLMLEVGLGVSQFRTEERPLGSLPYLILPERTSGSFFKTSDGLARRLQWVGSVIMPPVQWHGHHEFKAGTDVDRNTYEQQTERQPIFIRREDGTLSREITFVNSPRFRRNNVELSAFAQDRWSVTHRWLVELGLRLDWDEIIRRPLISPRFASSYLLTRDGETKITWGAGLFYDTTNLDFITRPLAGRRFDLFHTQDGRTPRGEPLETSFQVSERSLKEPRLFNWSLGLERKLPGALYLHLELLGKQGSDGFAFIDRSAGLTLQPGGRFELSTERRDRYHAYQVTLRRAFKENYSILASYTRSAARSSAVFDFSLDSPIFGRQMGGPLPWDAPNRLISWGWLPLVKGFDFAYSLDWRDGYPFSLVNQDQQRLELNARRLPAYFTLNTYLERRFRLFGLQLALRAGFNNATNHQNPAEVDNNVDSKRFLTFGGVQGRTFTGRIRFLGRK